jgi:hypothetical protein
VNDVDDALRDQTPPPDGTAQDTPRDPAPPQDAPQDLTLRRRVSDIEREDVAERLREAAGEGRLSYVELEERLEQAYGSKTYGELVKVTEDLPNGVALPATPPGYATVTPLPAPSQIKVILSESKRTGPWISPQHLDVSAVMGEVVLDYTEAQVPYREVTVDVTAVMADVTIRVPADAIVHLEGQPILGSIKEQGSWKTPVQPTTAESRVFHIRARAVMAEVKVKRGPSPKARLQARLGQ